MFAVAALPTYSEPVLVYTGTAAPALTNNWPAVPGPTNAVVSAPEL